MSKKQREKVEDEVRYHRAAQQRAQQVEIPDTTISSYNEGHQTPSSTDPHIFPAGYVSALSPINYPWSAFNLSIHFVTECHLLVFFCIVAKMIVYHFSKKAFQSFQWLVHSDIVSKSSIFNSKDEVFNLGSSLISDQIWFGSYSTKSLLRKSLSPIPNLL